MVFLYFLSHYYYDRFSRPVPPDLFSIVHYPALIRRQAYTAWRPLLLITVTLDVQSPAYKSPQYPQTIQCSTARSVFVNRVIPRFENFIWNLILVLLEHLLILRI